MPNALSRFGFLKRRANGRATKLRLLKPKQGVEGLLQLGITEDAGGKPVDCFLVSRTKEKGTGAVIDWLTIKEKPPTITHDMIRTAEVVDLLFDDGSFLRYSFESKTRAIAAQSTPSEWSCELRANFKDTTPVAFVP